MSGSKTRSWKILAMGRGQQNAEQAEKRTKHLHEIGYKNAMSMRIDNDKASDDKVIELLKGNDWDGVSIGGAINGFDNDAFPKEVATLHWFNRIVNLVHEHAPKAKLIFVTGPTDLADSFERVLGSLENPPETV